MGRRVPPVNRSRAWRYSQDATPVRLHLFPLSATLPQKVVVTARSKFSICPTWEGRHRTFESGMHDARGAGHGLNAGYAYASYR